MTDTEFRPIPLIEDQPLDDLEHDYLGLMPWAKMIAGAAIGTRGPFTIGVHQQWGYGKTTLLKMAKALVDSKNDKNVVTVWFNAWQFEREEHPLFPLIAAIADEIENKAGAKASLKKIGTSIRALARGMKFTGEVGMPLVGKVGAEFDAQKALEAEELLGNQSNPLQGEMMYHSAFEMLEKVAGDKSGAKIVVFIDDLDRCHPAKAIHLLESIKLILAQPGFLFIMGMDRRPIVGFLQKQYREHFEREEGDWGRFYLEKIIQLPIQIPSHRTRFDAYVGRLVDKLADKYGQNRDEIRALTSIQNVLAIGANLNPRSLIRFINNFLLDCNLWPLIDRKGDKQLEEYQNLSQDVAAALAFNRILEHVLGELCDDLINDQQLCSVIAADRARMDNESLRKIGQSLRTLARGLKYKGDIDNVAAEFGVEEMSEAVDDLERVATPQEEIIRRLSARPELLEALREYGKAWLKDEALRITVHEFAQTQRAADTTPEFPEPVAEAIQQYLGLKMDEPIPADKLSEVIVLDLNKTQVTDAGLQHLRSLTELEELHLGATQITDAGLQCLRTLTGLRALHLHGTRITDTGLQHLKGMTRLRELGLSETRVTDAGLKHLKGLTRLLYLTLAGTQVTDEGLQHISNLTRLQILDLMETKVTDVGLRHISNLTKLQWLNLMGTKVTDAGLQHLGNMKELELLTINGTEVTEAGNEELKRKLPKLGSRA